MSSESEDRPSPDECKNVSQKQLKISYTRDFLLSFSQLDICRKLPSGFDASVLSEFEDGSSSVLERQRTLGGSFLQNPKCSDYGTPPTYRLEGSSSYSRGSAGRWDTRSSGSSDKEGDLQSDRESFTQDSGSRVGNQTRCFWQHPEHDGLLGSGAFPRPSGYAGASAPKTRGNVHYQLNRSTEPYQPPRPYKAVPYSRKGSTDSCNDETFGSAEYSSEDRAEEERKRRASFELMRREQHKALQDKQKQIPDNHREKLDADIIVLLANSEYEKSTRDGSNMSDDSVTPTLSQNDSSVSSCPTQAPASRPLVPPGFASALMEKNNCMQSSSTSLASEYQGVKAEEETWNPAVSESSKFAHWFIEEEKKPAEDLSSRDLLSLIISSEKSGSQSIISSDKGIEHIPPSLPSENKDPMAELIPSSATSTIGIPEQYYTGEKLNSSSGVLMCEDLEQFILAEVKESSSTLQHSMQGPWLDGKSEEQKADVDDRASQHLLSLLQKGMKESESVSSPRKESSDKLAVSDVKVSIADSAMFRNSETVCSSEKTLTLEALFGSAFMNELHSVEAPLSVKRGSAGETINSDVTHSHGLPLPRADDGFFSSTSNEYRTNQSIHEGNLAASNYTQEAKAHNIAGPWVRYGDSPIEGSKLDVGFEEGAVEIQLPEEDSLITVGDSLDPIISDTSPFENANKEELMSEKTDLLNDKLLNAILRGGERLSTHGLDGPPLLRGHYDMVDSDNHYNQLHGRPSLQFPYQMNQTRPLFLQLDHLAYRNPQMKFMGPDSIHHDPHHPFPTNVIPQHAFNIAGGPRFDPAAHHTMLQHMPIPPNIRHQPIQGLPRGVPLSHPINHLPGYIPEMNNVHSFPLHNRQPNIGGLGMGMPGVGGGRVLHPEVLERLIEMERRASSKQTHPTVGGHITGIYGPEHDMNFRYR